MYIYAAEVLPTAARGGGIGLCSAAARVGSIAAPYAITLLSRAATMELFGALALAAAVVCRAALPETRQTALATARTAAAHGGALQPLEGGLSVSLIRGGGTAPPAQHSP